LFRPRQLSQLSVKTLVPLRPGSISNGGYFY
jgi:hypothetical protein